MIQELKFLDGKTAFVRVDYDCWDFELITIEEFERLSIHEQELYIKSAKLYELLMESRG
jgi:hypothetical protein